MKLFEPPSRSSASSTLVLIGRNRRGEWVAREQHGLFGGLFINRAQAIKYALFENGHHPEAIVELPRDVEIDILSPSPRLVALGEPAQADVAAALPPIADRQ
ncbi:hypothetical protein [Bradyrhizobium sp. ARR65]|uniref:hypothetical protein n=1 Tax=Bradyrhizobium sp. ARR65 TaxID=1040989 RepID=UPI000465D60A|nr:hypothetical protein [Bradyrhizobium sp. ARR65]